MDGVAADHSVAGGLDGKGTNGNRARVVPLIEEVLRVPLHVLQKIAGHADSRTTEMYLHPDLREVTGAGDKLSKHLRSHSGLALRVV